MTLSIPRRSRVVITTILVLGMAVTTACGDKPQAALPNTSDKVTTDRPLTATQATAVRDAARTLTSEIVDRVAVEGRSVNDRSYEAWTDCTAKQKDLFQTTYNGILYTATIYIDGAEPLPATDVHTLTEDLGVRWDSDAPQRGERGVFSVRLPDRGALGVTVFSPCYFLRDAGDDGLTSEEELTVTGFLRQEWQR